MNLTQKQAISIRNKSRYKVLNFGRRAGKTTLLAKEALGTSLTINNAKTTYYAQTYGDARDIAWEIFLEVFGGAVIKKNETLLELTLKNLKGGTSKVSLKGWESVVTSEKGRGTENDLILLDEVAFLRGFKHYWESVLEPTLLTTRGRAVFSSTPNGFNDFYELSNKSQQNEEWFYIHATSYDNPFNDKEWLDNKKKELPEDTFAQEYLADFRKQSGLVFKEFQRDIHLFEKKDFDHISFLGGVDFGFTNPAGIVSVRKDKRGTYWVDDEYYEKGKTDAQISEVVASYNFEKVYPDPENAGAIQELKNRRINVMEVRKGKDSIKSGISKIRELLKQNRLRISRSCPNLIWEIETYHYQDNQVKGEESELPEHENCHLIDALRYVILMDASQPEILEYTNWLKRSNPKRRLNPAI